MSRHIICAECARNLKPEHPEDLANGIHRLVVFQRLAKPSQHEIVVNPGPDEKRIPLPNLICDFCNALIPDGSEGACLTFWRKGDEIGDWESEYLGASPPVLAQPEAEP